jgi:hypothetical protein
MKNYRLRLVTDESAAKNQEYIPSIASFRIKHLSRLHEAALRARAKIHAECFELEKQKRELEFKYDQALKSLRAVQFDVEKLEHSILMENIKVKKGE